MFVAKVDLEGKGEDIWEKTRKINFCSKLKTKKYPFFSGRISLLEIEGLYQFIRILS